MHHLKALNVALVTRPIHLLILAEYLRVKRQEFFLIIISSNNKNEYRSISTFLYHLEQANVKINVIKSLGIMPIVDTVVFWLRVIIMSSQLKDVNSVILSGGVKGRILYKHLSFRELVLIDEGSSSKWRFPNILKAQKPFSEVTKSQKLYNFFSVNRLPNKSPFRFFSIYEVDGINSSLERNQFAYWRNLCKDFPLRKNSAIILGTTPHVYGVSREKYFNAIKSIVSDFGFNNVLYKPHRLYNDGDFKGFDEVSILTTIYPIEFYFIQERWFPEYFITFSSTASRTIELMRSDVNFRNFDLASYK